MFKESNNSKYIYESSPSIASFNPLPETILFEVSIMTEVLSLKQEKVLNELKICSLPAPLTKIEIYKLYYPEVVIVNEAVYI